MTPPATSEERVRRRSGSPSRRVRGFDARVSIDLTRGGLGVRRPLTLPEASRRLPLTIASTDNNIHYMRTQAPLLAPIFRSDGQARLLAELLLTGDELSLTDLAQRIDLAYATVHREAERLLDAGILRERQVGRSRLISANPDSPVVDPLRQILLVSTGPKVLLTEALRDIGGITSAFLYGSFAARMTGVPGPPPQDVDVMVVGSPDVDSVHHACDAVQERIGRPINPTILRPDEARGRTAFLASVAASPTVLLLGELPW